MEQTLYNKLSHYNKMYRAGTSEISDEEYDSLVEQLRLLNPNNPFLNKVEVEDFKGKKVYKHSRPMLSIDKAYTVKDMEKYLKRINKAMKELGLDRQKENVMFVLTPKVDGIAGEFDKGKLLSRGDGIEGFDISDLFTKGVVNGAEFKYITCYGEIVIEKEYFDDNLKDLFEHPRNIIAGVVNTVNPNLNQALRDRKIKFVPYGDLPSLAIPYVGFKPEIILEAQTLLNKFNCVYPTDGIVVEINNFSLNTYLGDNGHFHRAKIAMKFKGESKLSNVLYVQWQVGRTGNVTPLVFIKPIKISGATIKKVTGYNAGFIERNSLGVNSVVEIIRSGEVIPKIISSPKKGEDIFIPTNCPECDSVLVRNKDMLNCQNVNCKQRVIKSILFDLQGTKTDGFGLKTVKKIVEGGFNSIDAVRSMTVEDFISCGFGSVESNNLFNSIKR